MADYPSGVYSPRTKENKSGVVYAPAETTKIFAEDSSKLDDEVVAIETELGANPKGTADDVADRLDDVDTAIGGKQASLGYTPENVANKDTDGTLAANSDSKYPSQKAIKTYADTKVNLTSAQTLTNKRITPKVVSQASSSTPTPDVSLYDMCKLTALAVTAVFGVPTGTPTDGQKLIMRIKDNGTARAISFNAIYRASSDLALPTTTILSKTLYLGFIYNSTDVKWDLVALLNNF